MEVYGLCVQILENLEGRLVRALLMAVVEFLTPESTNCMESVVWLSHPVGYTAMTRRPE